LTERDDDDDDDEDEEGNTDPPRPAHPVIRTAADKRQVNVDATEYRRTPMKSNPPKKAARERLLGVSEGGKASRTRTPNCTHGRSAPFLGVQSCVKVLV
jgi:hypothetical protein